MERSVARTLREVRADTVSGASAIALRACHTLMSFSKKPWDERTMDELLEFLLALVRAQPNMAPVWNLANDVLRADPTAESVRSVCASHIEHHERAPGLVADNAAEHLAGKTVATNSSSSAVMRAILTASKRLPLRARVAESRPKREGLMMARELAKNGVDVTVCSDASLGLATVGADIAVVGCDAVTAQGVIGKVGLLHLALAAHERRIDVLVLADSSKFAPISLARDPRPAREVVERPPKGVRVENSYLEEVSLRHFGGILTERGMVTPRAASAAVRRIKLAPELESVAAELKNAWNPRGAVTGASG